MFVLCTIKDTIRIAPHLLPNTNTDVIDLTHQSNDTYIPVHNLHDILYDELSIKYNNTVVRDCGLIVSIYSIDSTGNHQLPSNDGGIHIHCVFRCVAFQPHSDEVLYGRILSSNADGIVVSTEWIATIFIPYTAMLVNTVYDASEGVFVWTYDSQQFYMDIGSAVAVKVTNVIYTELKPLHLKNSTTDNNMSDIAELAQNDALLKISQTNQLFQQPMIVLARIDEDGLGCTDWWL